MTVTELPLHPLRQVKVLSGSLEALLGQGCGDYVTAVLTGDATLDAFDLRDRLQAAFPYLLEIRREWSRSLDDGPRVEAAEELDPLSLCEAFLGEMDGETRALLEDAVNAALEVKHA